MARAVAVTLTPSDVRTFDADGDYRIGHYLERNKPYPANTLAILVIYRVPVGRAAPSGRLTHAQLAALAESSTEEVQPEVIARFPYWSSVDLIEADQIQITETDVLMLPPSAKDGQGAYMLPPNAYEPITPKAKAGKD